MDATDPLALGQRVIAILETGRRTATYKFATLTALVDHCVEHVPADSRAALDVPVVELTDRVIEIYWPQVRPFGGMRLRQSTQPGERIPREVRRLRSAVGADDREMSVSVARMREPVVYNEVRREVVLTLCQQPLHRLQELPGGAHDIFLYDDSWMHDKVGARVIAAHGVIRLLPGVAAGLARLSGLLKPTLEILWVEDVRRMNRQLSENVPDIAGHLFGRNRIPLGPARLALAEAFGPGCFYCGRRLAAHVDHVLPWSRVGIDGLANLVLACARCNSSKSQLLPAVEHTTRALDRDQATLVQIATGIEWPYQYERTVAAARGLYLSTPPNSPTWRGVDQFTRLDLAFPPPWIDYQP
ncbi:MAG TPA: HNH endonuclease [Aldersonia sp.]